jgi:hypothetical protein
MAVKPYRKTIVILAIIVGAAGVYIARSKHLACARHDESKFIATYVKLSIARERFANQPDSLRGASSFIYLSNRTDSLWMNVFSSKIAEDPSRGERIWSLITARLDTLRKQPNADGGVHD